MLPIKDVKMCNHYWDLGDFVMYRQYEVISTRLKLCVIPESIVPQELRVYANSSSTIHDDK